jgi:arsenate reductase
VKLLEEEGVEFQKVDYFKEPFSKSSLKALLTKAGLKPRDVLRKRVSQYKSLGLADETLSEAALLGALVEHPDLLERPIVERGNRAMLGRPIEAVRELF